MLMACADGPKDLSGSCRGGRAVFHPNLSCHFFLQLVVFLSGYVSFSVVKIYRQSVYLYVISRHEVEKTLVESNPCEQTI